MELAVLILSLCMSCVTCSWGTDVGSHSDTSANLTHPKDMYVLLATVYELGIVSNKTDNMTSNYNSTGIEESITLYRLNGTNMNLSAIPEPFLTNVTTRTLVGVAPAPHSNENENAPVVDESPTNTMYKRSLDNILLHYLSKRDTTHNTSIEVTDGAAVMSAHKLDAQSIFPFLVSLNNNMTKIPDAPKRNTQFSVTQ